MIHNDISEGLESLSSWFYSNSRGWEKVFIQNQCFFGGKLSGIKLTGINLLQYIEKTITSAKRKQLEDTNAPHEILLVL